MLLLLATSLYAQPVAETTWESGHPDRRVRIPVAFDAARPWAEGVVAPIGVDDGRLWNLQLGPVHAVYLVASAKGAPPQIWVDEDLDRDLSNDYGRRLDKRPFTTSVRTVLPGERRPRAIDIRFTWEEPDRWFWLPLVHRRGTVELAGRLRPVALVDADGDFRYAPQTGDRVLLDVNGDGEFDLRANSYEALPVGVPCRLGCLPVIGRSGETVRFEKAVVPAPGPVPWTPAEEEERVFWGDGEMSLAKAKAQYRKLRREKRNEKYPDIWVKRPIATIGRFRNKSAARFLWKIVENDPRARVRALAVEALGEPEYIEYEKRIAELARGEVDDRKLDDSGEYWARKIPEAAFGALHSMRAPSRLQVYLDALDGKGARSMRLSHDGLYRYLALTRKPEARAALAGLMERALRNPRGRMDVNALYESLRHFDEPPDPRWSRAVAERTPGRETQALALGDLWWASPDDARAVALARDPKDEAFRAAIARVLAMAGDGEALRALLAMDPPAPASVLRRHLAATRDDGGIDALIEGLDGPAGGAALEALGMVRRPKVADALLARLAKEATPELIRAVARQGDPRAADALVRAARAGGENVRVAALQALARMPRHPDGVGAFLASVVGEGSFLERVLAMLALRANAAVPAVVANVGHERWRVRLAAIRTLARLRPAAGVEPLIARMADEDERWRLRLAAVDALQAITNRRTGLAPAAWRRWWEREGEGFAVPAPRTAEPAATGETKSVARFYGIPIDSDRVVFLIDVSGSMAQPARGELSRLEVAYEELLGASAALPGKPRVNVVLFNNEVRAWSGGLEPVDRRKIGRFLRKTEAAGGTFLYDGLEAAFANAGADTIIVLTDGAVTGGKIEGDDAIVDAARALDRSGLVRLHGVAIGLDSPLLRRLAEQTGGRYVER